MTPSADRRPTRTATLPFPVVPMRHIRLPAGAGPRIEALAAGLRAAYPQIDDVSAFGPSVHVGTSDGQRVLFGDTAEIPLLGDGPEVRMDYRLGWLGAGDDLLVIGGNACEDFEAYQRQVLGAPDLRYLNIDPLCGPPRRATPALCLGDGVKRARLLHAMRPGGTPTLLAHLTTGTVWALAARLAQARGGPVRVAGPPPRLSRLANDKIWFGAVSAQLLGRGAVPPKVAVWSVSALVGQLRRMARVHDRLVIKLPDSAGSAGNWLVRATEVRGRSARGLYRRLCGRLARNGTLPRFPMLLEVWDTNVLASPSVQTWIPLRGEGPPVIEGVFEQVLSGETAVFAGAVTAALPARAAAALCEGALQIAVLFQRLGYFGRCSFDAILTGRAADEAEVHWIECNARWGGVSIPMSLLNRLMGEAVPPAAVIVQADENGFAPMPFAAALRRFADLAPSAEERRGAVFLTPLLMEAGAGCHLIAYGNDRAEAEKIADRIMQGLRPPADARSD